MRIHRIFFYLLIVFLPTQLGFHFWPEWAMVLGRRVDYLAPTIYLTDILILLTLTSWVLSKKFSIFNFQFSIKRRKFLIFKFVLLSVFIGLNIFFAASPFVALYRWIKVMEFSLLGLYVIKTRPSLLTTSYCLLAAVCYSSLIAIFQFIYQHSLGGIFWWLGERTFSASTPGIAQISVGKLLLRSYGTFPHPNVLAGFLVSTLPLIFNIQFSIFNQTKKFPIFKIIIVGLGIIALVLTFSRSAVVVGMVAIVFAIARSRNHELGIMKKYNIVFLVLSILLYSLFVIQFTPFSKGEESVVIREQLNQSAVKLFFQSPIVGVGLGNFLVKLPEALVSRQIYFLQPVHNIYLLVLAETGIVGFVLFSLLLIRVIFRELRIRNYGSIIHYSLFIILFLGLIDHYALTLQQGQLLLTLLLAFSFL